MPRSGLASAGNATELRLLEAAAREFALHGFAATRIRDIVDGAGVNLAAVNYHFGGKGGLYQATLAHLAREARDAFPIDSPELRAMRPEDQFRAYVRVMLMRYLGQEHAFPLSGIVAHELLDPTPAFGQIVQGVSKPQLDRLAEIVRALLGPRASGDDVALASLSAASQFTFFLFGRRLFEAQFPVLAADPAVVDRLAGHISAACLAAMRATREQLEGERRARVTPARPAQAMAKGEIGVDLAPQAVQRRTASDSQ